MPTRVKDAPKATGNTFVRAAEEGLIDVPASLHLGMRGTFYDPGIFEYVSELGYGMISYEEIRTRGVDDITAALKKALCQSSYLSLLGYGLLRPILCARSLCAHPRRPQCQRGLRLLRSLFGLHFVGFDINTVSPSHDTQGITALLAAQVMYDCLVLLCNDPNSTF